jgi:hypothetical protein
MTKERYPPRIVPVAIELGVAAGESLVQGGAAREAAIAVAAVLVKSFTDVLVERLSGRRQARTRAFVEEFFEAAQDLHPGVLEAKIHAFGDDPVVQEAVLEAVRGIDEALADVVVPALARLARLYGMTGRPADAFFRGMRRLLQDLNADAFSELVALLRTFRSDTTALRRLEADPRRETHLAHIIFLLRNNWIAGTEDIAGLASSTGPNAPTERVLLARSVALQMLAIVDSTEELRWLGGSPGPQSAI